jgi:hypothetical protein
MYYITLHYLGFILNIIPQNITELSRYTGTNIWNMHPSQLLLCMNIKYIFRYRAPGIELQL